MQTAPIDNYKQALNVKEIPSLNGWRAVAIIMVLLGHYKKTIAEETTTFKVLNNLVYAEFGVKIFFVLSGFLITTLLIKEKEKTGNINIKNFFIRRFLRIVPLLWLYLAVVAILNQIFNFNLNWQNFLGPLLYINNFGFFQGTWLTGHTWSLAVEEQYYIIWPFLFAKIKNTIQTCLLFILVTPILITIAYFKPALNDFLLLPFLQPAAAIFTGALLALIWNKNFYNINVQQYLKASIFYIACLIALAVCFLTHNGLLGFILLPAGDTILNILICYGITYSIVGKSLASTLLNTKTLVSIGILSYSIYIWQQLFLVPITVYTNWTSIFNFPINLIAIGLVAYLSYHNFEKHFLKLKHKFSAFT